MVEKIEVDWQIKSTIASGGAIFEIAGNDAGSLFMVSPAGLLRQAGDDWRLLMRGVPFWRTNCVAIAEKSLFLAGLPNGIIRSFNDGHSWTRSFIDQMDAPVVKMIASPSFWKDRVMLAGTAGDGILRSTDGGRHWQLSNFGLRDFNLVDLVTAPVWDPRYEYVFAISETAVYQSPNGGRAWRRGECADEIRPSAIAISPNFAQDQTVVLGTEAGQLYCSLDAGRQWELLADGLDMINALIFTDDNLLVGGMEQIISTSFSNPSKRTVHFESVVPILSLSQHDNTIYATLVDGVIVSEDNGRHWQPISPYAARRFVWVQQLGKVIVAAGPEEGVWVSRNNGLNWSLVWADSVVLALELSAKGLLVSSDTGLFVSADFGQSWLQEAAFDEPIMGLAHSANMSWYGSQLSNLRQKTDGGELTHVATPFKGNQLLDMQTVAEAQFTAVWNSDIGEVQLWKWLADVAEWRLQFSQRSQPVKPIIAVDSELGLLIALGEKLYIREADGWKGVKVSTTDAPITAVSVQNERLLIGATDRLLKISKDALEDVVDLNWEGDPILSILSQPEGEAAHLIVTVNGRVFVNHK